MNKQIVDYITSISKTMETRYNSTTGMSEYGPYWIFFGDGQGDFEVLANDASTDTLVQYIEYCDRQIELAKEYLTKEAYK
jgi:hypothetical protein